MFEFFKIGVHLLPNGYSVIVIVQNFHDEEFNFDTLNYTPEAFFLALPHIVTLDYKDDCKYANTGATYFLRIIELFFITKGTIVVRPTPEGEKILGHPNTRSDVRAGIVNCCIARYSIASNLFGFFH